MDAPDLDDRRGALSRARTAAPRRPRYRIRFPPPSPDAGMDQDEAFFFLVEEDGKEKIRFHDYAAIYERPGLYEQLFYDRLKCQSPRKVAEVLVSVLEGEGLHSTELRVLDLGAGNGMAGEALTRHGVARLVGTDIEPAASAALRRDRPGLYDEYYVTDLTRPAEQEELRGWSLDCLCCVAALGFGDIPPEAFLGALDLVADDGWVAFNIKESFLNGGDESGFSRMIRKLILSEHLHLYHLERYRHRLSIDGVPLHYFAIVARKRGGAIPAEVALGE